MKNLILIIFCVSLFIPIWDDVKWKPFGWWKFEFLEKVELMVNTNIVYVTTTPIKKRLIRKRNDLFEAFQYGVYAAIITETLKYITDFIMFS
ncbi:MAG: hypothetical protein DRR19_12535 [Candidatus Parabeggiatoa sp. nov. 1]|nr:MAG: hypothetical protein DRR19_12535 [Gammaproteobacteria bacterium]